MKNWQKIFALIVATIIIADRYTDNMFPFKRKLENVEPKNPNKAYIVVGGILIVVWILLEKVHQYRKSVTCDLME